MKDYKVKIIERLSTVVTVREENAGSAEEKVQAMYRNSEIVLTADDYVDTKFTILGGAAETISFENENPHLREVYVKTDTETIDRVPADFIEYNDFWAQHKDDSGFVLVYLDADNRIVD